MSLWMPVEAECSQLIAGAGVDPDMNHQNGIKPPERSWGPPDIPKAMNGYGKNIQNSQPRSAACCWR